MTTLADSVATDVNHLGLHWESFDPPGVTELAE